MDEIEKILKQYEFDVHDINNREFKSILNEFTKIVNGDFHFVDCPTEGEKVIGLKNQFVYSSSFVNEFFEILRKHNYNMKQEIIDAMFALGQLADPNKNGDIIKRFLASPIIQDISFDGRGTYTIISEQYGEFIYRLASYVYKRNEKISEYIKINRLPNHCHNHAYFLAGVLRECYAITSLCASYFKQTYYHSYTWDKESNQITDLCCNGVMDKDMYYRLYDPQELSVVPNGNVWVELMHEARKTDQPDERWALLRIALYKQYLDSIGYKGSLQDGPSLRKKV